MFGWLNRKKADAEALRAWRDAVTKAARAPEPYLKGWVKDTIYGRFNMVSLVATLALRRLQAEGPEGKLIAKDLSELLFSDFDHSLREHGVGDSSIARRIRKMGEEFFGLAKAVDTALDEGGAQKALAAVIKRNIQPDQVKASELAEYVMDLNERIERLFDEDVLKGPEAI